MFENTKDIVVNGAKAGRQVSGRSHSLTHLRRVKHTHIHMSGIREPFKNVLADFVR